MEKVLITPKNGVRVRKPDGSLLSPQGENLPRNSYWIRRELDGDVTIGKARVEKAVKK